MHDLNGFKSHLSFEQKSIERTIKFESWPHSVKKFHFLTTNLHVIHKPCATESICKTYFLSIFCLVLCEKCANVNVCVI